MINNPPQGDENGSLFIRECADTDTADVEVEKASGVLPKTLRGTLSVSATTHGGVIIVGLYQTRGSAATGLTTPARPTADFGEETLSRAEGTARTGMVAVAF